jgi:hypothetical protein
VIALYKTRINYTSSIELRRSRGGRARLPGDIERGRSIGISQQCDERRAIGSHREACRCVCDPIGLVELWRAPKEQCLPLEFVEFGRELP